MYRKNGSDRMKQSQARFNETYNEYLSKFGQHSLDRVVLVDPLNMGQSKEEVDIAVSNFEEGISVLKKAIHSNKPLEQIPEEMYMKLIF